MTQLRREHEEFSKREARVVVVGPESPESFRAYWQREGLPFVGLPDPGHEVLKLFGQQVRIFKLGRMPAQVVVDAQGVVRFVHYGHDMTDIPPNEELFALLDGLRPPA